MSYKLEFASHSFPEFIKKALSANFKIINKGDTIIVEADSIEAINSVIEQAKCNAIKDLKNIINTNIADIWKNASLSISLNLPPDIVNKLNYPVDMFSSHNIVDLTKIMGQDEIKEIIEKVCRYKIMSL